jgi:hypothetical protein
MEDVGIFYCHLVYFKALLMFSGHLVHFMDVWYFFSPFGILRQEKSGNPAQKAKLRTIWSPCHQQKSIFYNETSSSLAVRFEAAVLHRCCYLLFCRPLPKSPTVNMSTSKMTDFKMSKFKFSRPCLIKQRKI